MKLRDQCEFRMVYISKPLIYSHMLLMAKGCSPQNLEQVQSAGVHIQPIGVLLQLVQKRSLYKLKHQVPVAPMPPNLQQVHQVVMTKLL